MFEYFSEYESISIVGMAKNAGKTVTLNAILDEAYENGKTIGLTSIGRDGEKQDIVTCTEKPLIYVYEGSIIATPESMFEKSEAKMEVLEVTDFYTSMGKIIIGRVKMAGYIQIAGPCSNHEIMLSGEKMKAYGADLIIVDGAIDRKTTASPSITEATILSTGAVLSRDMDKAIEKTVYQATLFQLEALDDLSIRAIADEAIREKSIAIIGDEVVTLNLKTALNAGTEIAKAMKKDTSYVVLPGSLVTKTVMDIIKTSPHFKHTTFIVKDATRIFIDYLDWIYFNKVGVSICVLDKIKLIAVTINPTSPEGYYFDPETYQKQLQFYLKDLPVINVMT
ncbi:hypothetical protein [Acidaminobacter sp. JC074]|uniref:lysine 5,6-aminomutase reactivase subunit KamB n=1 Tax=Acidaminobacter sp. JC074 TaxID=2530199 RepID=UPI001F0D1D1D|nr:hypothetical protein [Acidaminobacter sp. JC074]